MASGASKGVWGRFGKVEQGGGGVWQQVGSQLEGLPTDVASARLSIWEIIGQRPGGIWDQLGSETIVQESTIEGLWGDALEETLILEGRTSDIWKSVRQDMLASPEQSDVDLWQEVGEETIVLKVTEESVWEQASGTPGFVDLRPERRLGYAIKRFITSRGETYYILKNIRQGSYLRLNEQQLFLWNLMDGENTVQDMAVAYMSQFGSLDVSILVDLLKKLETGKFLKSSATNIYDQTKTKIQKKGFGRIARSIIGGFLKKEFPIQNIDAFYTRTYNAGVKYFYSKPAMIISLILAVTGMAAYVYLLATGKYSVIEGGTSSTALGIISLYLVRTVALFIHEGGHAYTCKHYGREIRKSGVMIYYGFLAFYVDTTDIWLDKRIPRIMVSFGGPYTGFVLGGAASLIAVFSPFQALNGWMYQLAFLIILDSILNLNPLLKWDGYYILMDWLELPNLRTRSLNFLKARKPFTKLLKREHFNREERIFTLYGLSTFTYTAILILSFIKFFGESILNFIARFFDPVFLLPVIILLVLFLTRRKIIRIFMAVVSLRFSKAGGKTR
jgi:putative peptide zinc metalloprotease protein